MCLVPFIVVLFGKAKNSQMTGLKMQRQETRGGSMDMATEAFSKESGSYGKRDAERLALYVVHISGSFQLQSPRSVESILPIIHVSLNINIDPNALILDLRNSTALTPYFT